MVEQTCTQRFVHAGTAQEQVVHLMHALYVPSAVSLSRLKPTAGSVTAA